MDSEVGRTLAELERKLRELEHALALHSQSPQPEHARAQRPEPERVLGDRQRDSDALNPDPGAARNPDPGEAPPARLVDEGLRESTPPRPHTTAPPPPRATEPGREAAPSRAPTSAPISLQAHGDSIELSELVRFRDKLERTLRELVDEYTRIITLRKDPGWGRSEVEGPTRDDLPSSQGRYRGEP